MAHACHRLLALAAPVLLAACSSVATDPSRTEANRGDRPGAACSAGLKAPQIVATAPAVLPQSVWERKAGWESRLRFRIDEAGAPYDIRATVGGFDSGADEVERAVVAALLGYRFCRPGDSWVGTEWTARLRFRYSKVPAKAGDGEMFIQLFAPAYTRAEAAERRGGTVSVLGTFEQDGRPRLVRVATSSGDAVLDRKSLAAMATEQLVFRPGTRLERPLVLEQPYVYQMR